MTKLEESFSRLLDSVGSSAAFVVRIEALERKMTSLPETLGEMLARPHPVEAKLDSVRADMRALDITVDSVSAQMKNCEAICHTLGSDVRKLSTALEGIAGELRHTQERSDNLDRDRMAVVREAQSEISGLQERISRVESGVVRAIHLLQSSEQGSAQVAHLRERFQEIELGFQQVLQAVDSWQRAGESPEAAAERQATAKVLASLSNLLQGLRSAQLEKQGSAPSDKAIYEGALTA
jgi:chromosome segregation ATPase